MPSDAFHNVRDILPGTVTKMTCGPLKNNGDWGYLLSSSKESALEYVSSKDDPYPNKEFFSQLCEINPHKRS